MYKTFVRPHLDYCDIIYHEPPKIDNGHIVTLTAQMEEVEKVQYKAALTVTGAWKGSNRSKLYDELGWEPLTYRRLSNRLLMLFKIVNRLIPFYLGEKLPPVKNPFSDESIVIFPDCISYSMNRSIIYFKFETISKLKLDFGTWKINNYGYLLGLETWDPGNIGKRTMLIT